MSGSITIVCSDCSRNGKTLFAKLAADLLHLRTGKPPHIFDTDDPDGGLIHQFPGSGQIIDVGKTPQQVALFDGMLNAPQNHYLVDLSARHFSQFFKIYTDIAFEEGAREAGLDICVFYIIDRDPSSVETFVSLAQELSETTMVPVRNAAIGDALADTENIKKLQNLRLDRMISLPDLSSDALGMVEHADFHFDTFIAGHYDHFPFELKAELWAFMEALYEQRESAETGSTHPI